MSEETRVPGALPEDLLGEDAELLRSDEEPGADGASSREAYRFTLGEFEGPLDLLLFLIKKNEINIYDIPIARITEEYLSYLELMKMLNLETAGEFLLLAATLIRIKARMLLPRDPGDQEEEEIEDPREALGRLLLEHAKFQRLGVELGEFAERESHRFARHGEPPPSEEQVPADYIEATLFDLLAAFRRAMAHAPSSHEYRVEREEVSLEEMMAEIRERLEPGAPMKLLEVIRAGADRTEIIVLFLAVLELTRQGALQLRQLVPFGDIWLQKRAA
jgi:segregation and condensation protein A